MNVLNAKDLRDENKSSLIQAMSYVALEPLCLYVGGKLIFIFSAATVFFFHQIINPMNLLHLSMSSVFFSVWDTSTHKCLEIDMYGICIVENESKKKN